MKTMAIEEQKNICDQLLDDIETQVRIIEKKPKQSLNDYELMKLLQDVRTIIRRCMEKTF